MGRIEITGNLMQLKEQESFDMGDMSQWLEMSEFFVFALLLTSPPKCMPSLGVTIVMQ